MSKLIIASNNKKKIQEIREILPEVSLLSLKDMGFEQDIPEPYNTFSENAAVKANTIYAAYHINAFADDSGICVPALGGAPGVFSARYAGEPTDDERNLQKLLRELDGKADRSAYYKAVICLVWEGKHHFFEGECHGVIALAKSGNGGFGYDPIFVPNGYSQTFGELPPDVKHSISHRGKAVREMADFIKDRLNEQ